MADETIRQHLEAIRDATVSQNFLPEGRNQYALKAHGLAVAALALLDAAEVEHYSDVVPDYGGNLARRYRLIPDPDQPDA